MTFDRMNEQSEIKTSREDERSFFLKSQLKGTCTTCVNVGTKENTACRKKVQTYQDIIAETNLDISGKTIGMESGKKRKRTTTINVTRRNIIIAT